jgi:hypothetical protein
MSGLPLTQAEERCRQDEEPSSGVPEDAAASTDTPIDTMHFSPKLVDSNNAHSLLNGPLFLTSTNSQDYPDDDGRNRALAVPLQPLQGMEKWVGKVALVTGASSGIGLAVCEELAVRGMLVVAIARRQDRLEQLQKHLLAIGVPPKSFLPVVCDITKEAEVSSGEAAYRRNSKISFS